MTEHTDRFAVELILTSYRVVNGRTIHTVLANHYRGEHTEAEAQAMYDRAIEAAFDARPASPPAQKDTPND